MPCHFVNESGVNAIVCTGGRAKRCKCGRRATRLCDWKVKTRKSGTCDEPLCDHCAVPPAPNKDLCPKHSAQWAAMLEARQ